MLIDRYLMCQLHNIVSLHKTLVTSLHVKLLTCQTISNSKRILLLDFFSLLETHLRCPWFCRSLYNFWLCKCRQTPDFFIHSWISSYFQGHSFWPNCNLCHTCVFLHHTPLIEFPIRCMHWKRLWNIHTCEHVQLVPWDRRSSSCAAFFSLVDFLSVFLWSVSSFSRE